MPLIPKPESVVVKRSVFKIQDEMEITVDSSFARHLRQVLEDALVPATGYRFTPSDWGRQGLVLKRARSNQLGDEGYRITVTTQKIEIEAASSQGAFYGIQTLRQLLPPEIFAKSKQSGIDWIIPCCEIVDRPRFKWRGMHMDVSRHFMSPDYIKRFIDLMALHKMNVFHWHLCDDDGWRIEIKKYPELTDAGSSRSRSINYGKPTFYTQSEIQDIVQYAKERYVTIVPEIEMPGHAKAAIEVYPVLGARNDKGQLGNVYNLRDTTITFLKDVLSEVTQLFRGPYIHCGGDEVLAAWVWERDPESKERAQQLGLSTPHEIQTWFMNEMAVFLASKGRRMVGWGEVAGDKLRSDTVVMAWRGRGDAGYASAKKGFDVVMAPDYYTYFDHRQAPDEKGWGKSVVSLDKVYGFDPAAADKISGDAAMHIIGTQGQLWTEMIATEHRMDYMAFPRECALAEVAWTPQAERNFSDFQDRMRWHYKRLKYLGVNFRVPVELLIQVKELKEKKNYITISAEDKEGRIHYTLDGSEPSAKSPLYRGPLPTRGIDVLKARLITDAGRMGAVASYVGPTTPPLTPVRCRIEGGMKVEELRPGQKSVGKWGNPQGRLIWDLYISQAGKYDLFGYLSAADEAQMVLSVDGRRIPFRLTGVKGWFEPVKVKIGSVDIAHDGRMHKVVLSVDKAEGYTGINMWKIEWERKADRE